MSTATFGTADYAVFGLMLTASVSIGIYYAIMARKRGSTSEYFIAGQSMSSIPVALSLLATYESSVMMLGTPAESYAHGIQWILSELGSETGMLINIFLILVFLRRLNLSTPFEYYERRFKSRRLRVLANLISCLSFLQYISIVLYGQAIALRAMTGFSTYGSIVATAAVAVIYTTIGGLKAVIWTDVLQFIIMITGLLAVSIKGTVDGGGVSEVWLRAAETGRLDFSMDPDPTVRHTIWNLYFGRILTGFGFLFSPSVLQRISSTKSLKECRRALLLTIPGFTIVIGMALAEGIVAYGYFYHKRCDPLASKQVGSPNQIIPFLILELFRNQPGLSGLFLAALASASLSTISSCLSAVASIIWYDLIKPWRPNTSEYKGVIVAKITVVFIGILGCLAAVLVSLAGAKTLNQIVYTFKAATDPPLVAMFFLGAFFSFVNTKGAITGLVTGVGFMLWLCVGSMFSDSGAPSTYLPLAPIDQCPGFNMSSNSFNNTTELTKVVSRTGSSSQNNTRSALETVYNLSYTLFYSFGLILVLLVGICASWITGGNKTPVDPECLIHLDDIHCLPARLRRYLAGRGTDRQSFTLTPSANAGLREQHDEGLPPSETETIQFLDGK
ncbi:sodium-coupled monocarboxylate transporter 1-like [Haliotis rubra]|uniref:sodium-coupled monocarboxylate transporter 1-like n=1 Tax=Haliotis rubra TaxID=36100 RepID=UPI001EE52762|nr:sodium-coupled monocarboxylate transporter 1-like [Haliotis rubra]